MENGTVRSVRIKEKRGRRKIGKETGEKEDIASSSNSNSDLIHACTHRDQSGNKLL